MESKHLPQPEFDAGDFLSPAVGQILPVLAQAQENLIREMLVRELTRHTEELCMGDPELAEIMLEGKKSLPGCVRYVLEQAAKKAAVKLDAMPDEEFKELPKQEAHGRSATVAGVALSSEDVFQLANDYYYKAPADKVKNDKKAAAKNTPGKKTGGKKASGSAPSADKGKAKDKDAMDGGTQMTLGAFADTGASAA